MNNFFDVCYPVAAIFRVIEALQRANKDFDMLVLPILYLELGVLEVNSIQI